MRSLPPRARVPTATIFPRPGLSNALAVAPGSAVSMGTRFIVDGFLPFAVQETFLFGENAFFFWSPHEAVPDRSLLLVVPRRFRSPLPASVGMAGGFSTAFFGGGHQGVQQPSPFADLKEQYDEAQAKVQ